MTTPPTDRAIECAKEVVAYCKSTNWDKAKTELRVAEIIRRHMGDGMDSPTWPHVLAFAKRMEAKLAKNRHKGDREGWLKEHPWDLVERVLDETVEVQQCFTDKGDGPQVDNAEALANECADVANFCMMVADSAIDSERGKERKC